MNKIWAIAILTLVGCGGGGGEDEPEKVVVTNPQPTATPILVTQCGDLEIHASQMPAVEAAAAEEGVDLTEIDAGPLDPEDFPCVADGIQQCTKTGIIVAACGSTVINDESTTTTTTTTTSTNTNADRLIAAIRAHEITSIEVRR